MYCMIFGRPSVHLKVTVLMMKCSERGGLFRYFLAPSLEVSHFHTCIHCNSSGFNNGVESRPEEAELETMEQATHVCGR